MRNAKLLASISANWNDSKNGAFVTGQGENQRGCLMRKFLLATSIVVVSFSAVAQQSPPANRDANTPAVNSPNSPPNPGAPVAGANSFTEGQAKARIEEKGFKSVTGLQKDANGVWRGKADQNGKSVNVSIDFQGNVVGQ
jgi:hypothetical protein